MAGRRGLIPRLGAAPGRRSFANRGKRKQHSHRKRERSTRQVNLPARPVKSSLNAPVGETWPDLATRAWVSHICTCSSKASTASPASHGQSAAAQLAMGPLVSRPVPYKRSAGRRLGGGGDQNKISVVTSEGLAGVSFPGAAVRGSSCACQFACDAACCRLCRRRCRGENESPVKPNGLLEPQLLTHISNLCVRTLEVPRPTLPIPLLKPNQVVQRHVGTQLPTTDVVARQNWCPK